MKEGEKKHVVMQQRKVDSVILLENCAKNYVTFCCPSCGSIFFIFKWSTYYRYFDETVKTFWPTLGFSVDLVIDCCCLLLQKFHNIKRMEPEEQVEYKIQRLNLLAFPRDANPVCELTGARASVELVTQYLTL